MIRAVRNLQTTTPDGDTYDVAVDWMPRWRMQSRRFLAWRRRRKRGRLDLDGLDLVPFDLDGPAALVVVVVAVIGVVVAAVVFWWVLLPVLLAVLDAAAIALLLAAGVLTRVLLRRPWTVSVRVRGDEGAAPVASIDVVGWRRALRTRDALAAAVRQGTNPITAALAALPA
jgi:hypothetical protein